MAIIKGFLFDLDGVIVDTAQYHFKAWQRLGRELDIDFDEKANEELKGVSRKDSLEKILQWGDKQLPQEDKERLMDRKNQWYLEYVEEMKPEDALPGALDFLDKSIALNLRIGLGSASKNARKILDLLEITDRFEVIIDGKAVTKSKPDPEVFLKGAEGLELAPEEVVVYEDSVAGIKAAGNGGFRRVGIGNAKVLKSAEIVLAGLHESNPAEVINKLNF